jgi:1-acyl-sn-glycerol-3-phosphate acyltransferase
MAKKELFDIPFIRWWIDWLGAFAVDRGNLAPSTVKTVKQIKKSKWVFGIFPQGTRQAPGEISNVGKGFAGLARMTKCNVLPVGIIGTNEKKWLPFSGKIIIRVGKIIPYSEDLDAVRVEWIKQIEELTGFKYVEKEDNEKTSGGLENNEQE